jgi:5S rRNA maturation endonuclease (ribonuclease M5)
MMTINRTGLKETILDRCNELDIYSHYCGAKVIPGRTMKSPLREGDKNPSFNVFKTKDGRYMFKDFAGQSGDVFKFVMLMFNIDFSDACKRISFDMKVDTNPAFERIAKIKSRSTLINIHPVEKKEKAVVAFNMYEGRYRDYPFYASIMRFFHDYSINISMAEQFYLFFPYSFTAGKYSWTIKNVEDFAMAMKYESGNMRFYRPHAKAYGGLKHVGNSDAEDIFGMQKLQDLKQVKAVIICAGQKDTLVLQSLLQDAHLDLVIRCICLNSESCSLSISNYMKIREKTDKIYSIYDNDQTGLKYAEKLQNDFAIRSLTKHFSYSGAKDVADHCKLSNPSRQKLLLDILAELNIK